MYTKHDTIPDHLVAGQSSTTIFVLHGAFGSKDYWRFQIRRFVDAGFRVVAWDAPGYGTSSLPQEVTLKSIAEAAARLIEYAGTETNVIVGHSMGGQISPRICRLVPDRIHALVISSTIGWFGNKSSQEQEEFVKHRSGQSTTDAHMASSSQALVTSMFGPGAAGPDVELVKEVVSLTPPSAFRASIDAIRTSSDIDSLNAIERIRIPTLCIAGELDLTGAPDGMRRLAERIKGSEFAIIPGAGHYGWAERPELFNKLVLDFLARKLSKTAQAEDASLLTLGEEAIGHCTNRISLH
jgi:3-oxoadipate enol-lactonase